MTASDRDTLAQIINEHFDWVNPGEGAKKAADAILAAGWRNIATEWAADWPEPARCRSTTASGVRCGLPERHVLSGPRLHCANPTRGDGSTWTGPGFVQWKDEPP